MALPIRWTPAARAELRQLIGFIAEHDPAAAMALRVRVEQSVLPLAEHPYLFRRGRVGGTREIVAHPNYIVVYRVGEDAITIVSVVHARQRYP